MVVMCLILACVVSFYISRRLFQDVFTPMSIYVGVWCVGLLLFHLRILDYDPLTWLVVLIFAGSLLFFVIGCFLAKAWPIPSGTPRILDSTKFERSLKLLVLLSAISLLLYWSRMDRLYGLGTYATEPWKIRANYEEWSHWGVLAPLILIYYPAFVASCIHIFSTKRVRWYTFLGFVLPIIETFLGTDRGTLVLMLLTGAFVWIYCRGWRRINKPILLVFGSVSFLLVAYFVGLGTFYRKTVFLNGAGAPAFSLGAIGNYLKEPYLYITGSFAAFQSALTDVDHYTWGARTFFPFARLLNAAGLLQELPDWTSRNFYYVPIPVNTYTHLYTFYQDFGVLGVFLMPLALGCLETRLYMATKVRATVFNIGSTGALMAMNVFSIFISVGSTAIFWNFLLVIFVISRYCMRPLPFLTKDKFQVTKAAFTQATLAPCSNRVAQPHITWSS
jgi:oligosaccharide repeat unit polymerase